MEFVNALQEVGIVFHALFTWVMILHWYWMTLMWILFTLLTLSFVIGPIYYGYQKPMMWNDNKVSLKIPMIDDERYTPIMYTFMFLFFCVIAGVFSHYLFPYPFLKTVAIILIVTVVVFLWIIVYYYGYAFFPMILILLITIQWMALKNVSLGLTDIPPHYVFDWWGYGWQSHSHHHWHFLPLANFTLNPTRYEYNANQYLYIILLFILYLGLIINLVNLIKWRFCFTFNPEKPGHNFFSSLEAGDSTSNEKLSDQSNNSLMSTTSKDTAYETLHEELKRIGFSERAITHLCSHYSTIRLLDILDEINQRTDIDQPKEYLMSKLEENSNG